MSCCESSKPLRLDKLSVDENQSNKYKMNIFKVVLLGDSKYVFWFRKLNKKGLFSCCHYSVGKTCLLRRFVRDDFQHDYNPSAGNNALTENEPM